MVKNFNSADELVKCIVDDISLIYNKCTELGIVTDKTEDVIGMTRNFLDYMYKEASSVSLMQISGKYVVSVHNIMPLEGVVFKRNGIIDYHDKFVLSVFGIKSSCYLSGHPFIEMSLDDLVMYMKNDCVCRSDNFKFRYDLLKEGQVVYSVYGKDNSCVYDYFKTFGATSIKSSKVDGSNDYLYKMKKDGEDFSFVIRRSSLQKG